MFKSLRQVAAAAVFSGLSLASAGSWAASYTYDFKTFFDTSTVLNLLDTKTLSYSVASLTIADISGGVQLSLTQLNNSFAAAGSAGTNIDALWLSGPSGTLKSVSGTGLALGAGYLWPLPLVKDAGYTYQWDIDFASGGVAEGKTAVMTILGSGVSAAAFASKGTAPMINLAGVGKPYSGLLGLDTVHFVATPATPAVPEASTFALMGLGLAGVAMVARRRRG